MVTFLVVFRVRTRGRMHCVWNVRTRGSNLTHPSLLMHVPLRPLHQLRGSPRYDRKELGEDCEAAITSCSPLHVLASDDTDEGSTQGT